MDVKPFPVLFYVQLFAAAFLPVNQPLGQKPPYPLPINPSIKKNTEFPIGKQYFIFFGAYANPTAYILQDFNAGNIKVHIHAI
jgi:hypothetical protein